MATSDTADIGTLYKGDNDADTSVHIARGALKHLNSMNKKLYASLQEDDPMSVQIAKVTASAGSLMGAVGGILGTIVKKEDDQTSCSISVSNKSPYTLVFNSVTFNKGCYVTESIDLLLPDNDGSLKFSINHDYNISDIIITMDATLINPVSNKYIVLNMQLQHTNSEDNFGLTHVKVTGDYGGTVEFSMTDASGTYNGDWARYDLRGAWFVAKHSDHPSFAVTNHTQSGHTENRSICLSAFEE